MELLLKVDKIDIMHEMVVLLPLMIEPDESRNSDLECKNVRIELPAEFYSTPAISVETLRE